MHIESKRGTTIRIPSSGYNRRNRSEHGAWAVAAAAANPMKDKIAHIVSRAVGRAFDSGRLFQKVLPEVEIEEPKIDAHGDFSTNVAMVMASVQKMAPRKIAEAIVEHVDDLEAIFEKIEIAGPGFINFFIRPSAWHPILQQIHEADGAYGSVNIGNGRKIQVEFVSANPTGPLHVGHGRGAAVGDSIANLLSFCGFDVQREYYINDSGNQIRTLGLSVYLRFLQLQGQTVDFPEDCYQGQYIQEIAEKIGETAVDLLAMPREEGVLYCARFAAHRILDEIRKDLEAFGVTFDRWFSEQSLYDSGKIDEVIREFQKKGFIYEKDGALWFSTSAFGDEKDRVVVRGNGNTTYFASDIAYHQDKFDRGFERVIDVWGADHHGYIPRMTASIEAAGRKKDQFHVILVHLVNLLRGGEPVAMSTRAGEFVTLKNVVDEVGRDAARFLFLTRHYESPLDFDLEIAKKQSIENPVYYVQYVHARISSIIRKGTERGMNACCWNADVCTALTEFEELILVKTLARYPDIVRSAAEAMEPHRIAFYLMNLSAGFHAYYNKHRVLSDDPVVTQARLVLILAVRKVIRNGLTLLGVSAPEQM